MTYKIEKYDFIFLKHMTLYDFIFRTANLCFPFSEINISYVSVNICLNKKILKRTKNSLENQ